MATADGIMEKPIGAGTLGSAQQGSTIPQPQGQPPVLKSQHETMAGTNTPYATTPEMQAKAPNGVSKTSDAKSLQPSQLSEIATPGPPQAQDFASTSSKPASVQKQGASPSPSIELSISDRGEASTPRNIGRDSDKKRLSTQAASQTSSSAIDDRPESISSPLSTPKAGDSDAQRRIGRTPTMKFRRTMSNLFHRSNVHLDRGSPHIDDAPRSSNEDGPFGPSPAQSVRDRQTDGSLTTTRSNTPPSPTSPVELTHSRSKDHPRVSFPATDDFFGRKKKNRASTGLGLRGKGIHFGNMTVGRHHGEVRPQPLKRSSSAHSGKSTGTTRPYALLAHEDRPLPPERLPWALPPDSGTGAKARRISLSLPDDFHVDVSDLHSDFEYQSKILGRHGKHLGKGAASKVSLMVRKGSPGEFYAVKEFRGKSNKETQEDYDNKIKSEYSIAKSLHHPNIVETISLCIDSNRWNHVMEWCSEGDLFGLVQKGHLKSEDRKKDRLCLFKQLIQGVNYLHSHGIAHRDIKLENLLITKDSKLKITDFGVSEVFSGTHPGLREAGGTCGQNMGDLRLCDPGICGSEPYIAPEVLEKRDRYDPRALDVWSSAIVMIYLSFGGAIWSRAEKGMPQYDKLVASWEKWYGKHESADATISESDYPRCYALDLGINPPALRRIILQMLNPDPSKRISIADVLNNRWMKNVECCQLESYDDPALLVDASKRDGNKAGSKKLFCHSHLPIKGSGGSSLGKMPGTPGY